ncbi:MAG: winged helix-turn-helix domain-containing protein [Actinomycetota bacterium]|nr:winged helix-turn-helix domain-containing protein [Actinomycetota bacterium]
MGNGSTSLDFRLLGPMEVRRGSEQIPVGGPKQRAVLAMLLLARGRPVSTDRLVRGLWATPPSSAENVIQVGVSRLRRALGSVAGQPILVSTTTGYAVQVAPKCFDLARFESLLADGKAALARGDPATAAETLGTALVEWRGEPLMDFTSEPFADLERLSLNELRIEAVTARLDAEMALGRHFELVVELLGLTAELPFHEPFWERLVVCLYRGGRQADALAAIERVEKQLRTELGVSPRPALAALRVAVLTQDPVLDLAGATATAVEPRDRKSTGTATNAQLRGRELALMTRMFERTTLDGQTRLVTLLGRPGMGKTMLAAALSTTCGEANLLRLTCDPDASGAGLDPLLALDPVAPAAAAPDAGSLAELRLRIRASLTERARKGPLVLVVDDLEAASEVMLDAVEELGRLARGPILMVVCARPELLERRPGWGTAVPRATMLPLEPLHDDEVAAMSTNLLCCSVAPSMVGRLARASGGSPLVLAELLGRVGLLMAEGKPVDQAIRGVVPDGPTPVSFAELIAGRLQSLPETTREVAGLAAVCGRDFEVHDLESVVGEGLRAAVPGNLEQLVEAGLLASGSFGGGFSFSHELVRTATYDALAADLKSEAHARCVEVIMAKDGSAPLGGLNPSHLRHHLARARALLVEPTATWSRAAARIAARGRASLGQGDVAGAVELLESVVPLLGKADPLRFEVLVALGSALADVGQVDRASAVLTVAHEQAEALGLTAAAASARIELSWLNIDLEPTASGLDALVADVTVDLARLSSAGDGAGKTRGWLLLGTVANIGGHRRTQVAAGETVLADEPSSRRDFAVAVSLVSGGMAEGPFGAQAVVDRVSELLDLAPGDPGLRAATLGPLALGHALLGQFAPARRRVAEARELVLALDKPWSQGMTALRSAQIEDLAGRPVAAERDARLAAECYRRIGESSHLSTVAAVLAHIVCSPDRLRETQELVDRCRALAGDEDVVSQILWRTAAARIALARGRPDAAEKLLDAAASRAAKTDLLVVKGDIHLIRAMQQRQLGNVADASRCLDRGARAYRGKGSVVLSGRVAVARRSLARTTAPQA